MVLMIWIVVALVAIGVIFIIARYSATNVLASDMPETCTCAPKQAEVAYKSDRRIRRRGRRGPGRPRKRGRRARK